MSLRIKLRLYFVCFMELLSRRFRKNGMKWKLEHYRIRGMVIGEGTKIFSTLSTREAYLIRLGENVTIASSAKLVTHDNSISKVMDNASDLVGQIVIGDNCFIGAYSIILPGVTIGKNTIVGAGSLVTKSFGEGLVIAGNPAKTISSIDKFMEKNNDYAFDFKGINYYEKQNLIMNNPDKWIKR